MQQETLGRLDSLERSVGENTGSIKTVNTTLDGMGEQLAVARTEIDALHTKVATLELDNTKLREKCYELDAYKRRWNLRVANVCEQEGENVKEVIIDLFSQVSPGIANQLSSSVDIAHRLGPRSDDATSPRRIIVQFISRTHRDIVWRDARQAAVLKDKKIRIFEDLTQEVKDARDQLWPLVEKARHSGIKAGFKGAVAVINGQRITVGDLTKESK